MVSENQQRQYQVRLGLLSDSEFLGVEDLDVVVIASAFGLDTSPANFGGRYLVANLPNRTAVAERILERQVELGGRCIVAIALPQNQDLFSVGDFLVAGAVVDALANLGIDYCSPEAAAACASFQGLRNSIGHVLSASVQGRRLLSAGNADQVSWVSELDSVDRVGFQGIVK